ncbi:zinc finger CCCH domain-containing protein 13-like isoform X3 [Scylla paramamosain]|uniref:zinc finger CCCH domain-containing protein 13-like isoform X3 n=1 Tax=Scylla paramamosain TaxID=85552 RepID=UPI003083CF51
MYLSYGHCSLSQNCSSTRTSSLSSSSPLCLVCQYSPECCSSAYEEDFVRMWKRAVWLEGKKEEEGVVPSSWVLEENQTLFWPQGVNAENALHNQQEPDPASWRKFMLKKVKITSDSFQECDTYHLTSTVESSESNSDPDEGLLMRKRRKRCKKNLPDDFVSSENLHEAVHMKPASQKPQVTTSQDKVASAPSQVVLPTPPPKVSLDMRSTRTHGMMECSATKDSVSSKTSKSSDNSDGSGQHDRRHHDTPYQKRNHDRGDNLDHHDRRHHDTPHRRRSHDQGDSPDHHDTPHRRGSHDQGDRRHHDTPHRRGSHDQGDRRHHDTPHRRRSHDQGDRRHHDTPYRRRSHDQGDSPNHLSYYSDSPDQHDKRHHDTSYRRRSHDQGDSPDHLSYYSDSPDQHDKRHHDTLYRRRSHDQGDRRQLDTPDRSDSPGQQERRYEKHYQNRSHDHYDWDNRRDRHNQRDNKSMCDPCNDNQKNHKGSQEDAESSFPLTKFQKRVLQLLLDIRKTVSDTSTCGGKPADTACTLTIKRNNSLEEVQNLEDELVNPSYFM